MGKKKNSNKKPKGESSNGKISVIEEHICNVDMEQQFSQSDSKVAPSLVDSINMANMTDPDAIRELLNTRFEIMDLDMAELQVKVLSQ